MNLIGKKTEQTISLWKKSTWGIVSKSVWQAKITPLSSSVNVDSMAEEFLSTNLKRKSEFMKKKPKTNLKWNYSKTDSWRLTDQFNGLISCPHSMIINSNNFITNFNFTLTSSNTLLINLTQQFFFSILFLLPVQYKSEFHYSIWNYKKVLNPIVHIDHFDEK